MAKTELAISYKNDNRSVVPEPKAIHYYAYLAWHGRFQVQDSKIKPVGETPLKTYEGKTADEFIAEISAAVGSNLNNNNVSFK